MRRIPKSKGGGRTVYRWALGLTRFTCEPIMYPVNQRRGSLAHKVSGAVREATMTGSGQKRLLGA
jgi:hypothetical protein